MRKIPSTFLKGFLRNVLHSAKRGGKSYSKHRVPKIFAKDINEKDIRKAWKGIQHQSSPESLLAWLPLTLAEKALGKQKVRDVVFRYVNKPALMADMSLGRIFAKTPLVGKKLFRIEERIPWGKNVYKNIERSSALGPLIKVRDVATPILVGVGLEKGLKKIQKTQSKGNLPMDNTNRELNEKVASKMLQLHDENKKHKKKEHALKLLYKQAELGYAPLPTTYSELEEKLAELITQENLEVLEKALDLTGGNMKIGELDRTMPSSESHDASERFLATIMGEF